MSDAAAHATITLAQSTAMLNGERAKGNFNTDKKMPSRRLASRRSTAQWLPGPRAGERLRHGGTLRL